MALTTSACPTGDDKVVLFGLLLETNARLSRDLDAELLGQGAVPLAWFEVLLRLHQEAGNRLKMNQVAEAIVHSSGGTTRLVDRLEDAGLVRRENCPQDRRAVYVAITALGEDKLSEALSVHLRYLDVQIAARLSPVERDALVSLLTKLNPPRD